MKKPTANTINVTLPTSWQDLSQQQLRYVFLLIAKNFSAVQLKVFCFVRWNKIKVSKINTTHTFLFKMGKQEGLVTTREVQKAIATLDFLDSYPDYPVRLEQIKSHAAINPTLEGVPFEKYLYLDNLFQGYLHTQDMALLEQMAQILYDSEEVSCKEEDLINVFYWFASLKKYFSYLFPNFLQPVSREGGNMMGGDDLFRRFTEATNAQLRALTGGDVTKEAQVRALDTLRALTELDAKAKEAEEMRKIAKRK